MTINEIRRSRFIRNALTLGGGTAAGQALVFVVTPILTRSYGPAAMAMLGMYLAFLSPATVALALRFDVAIVVAKSDTDAGILLVVSLAILPFTSAVAAAVFGVLAHYDVGGYGAFPSWAVPVTAVMLAMAGGFTSLRFWSVRAAEFRDISHSLVQQGAARALLPLAIALFTNTWVGLLAGEIAGRILGVRRLLSRASGPLRSAWVSLNWAAIAKCFRTYRQFPLLHLPSSVIDAAGASIPTPLFASAYGVSEGGQFFLAHRVVLAPAMLIGAAVADVYHHRIAEAARAQRDGCRREVKRAGGYLLLIGTAIYLPVAIVAPVAASWVFGAAWTETGWAIAALAPAAVSATVTNPLSRAISLSTVPQAKWVADVGRFGLPVAAILASAAATAPFVVAVACFAVATVVGDLVYFLIILYTVAPHRLRPLTDAEGG